MKEIYMDIHTHIIPGVDDGSDSMEQSMEMIEQAYNEGIRVMIATPHYGVVNYDYDGNKAQEALQALRQEVKKIYPDMHLFMGNEIYYTQGIADDLLEGKAKSLAGTSYVLVEFNTAVELDVMKRAIDEFTLNGYRTILAHIERYKCLEDCREAVQELIDKGAYIQLNCRSIVGGKKAGKGRKGGLSLENRSKWCRKLLEGGLVHFIASDCHDNDRRRPMFRDAIRFMVKWIGKSETKQIVNKNIIHLIKNEAID